MEEKKILIKEDDLLEMAGNIIKKWKFIFLLSFCFGIFGMIIALSTPRSYTAEVVVAPEASGSSSSVSGISSLASMVGIDFGMGDGGDAIYPLLYPEIIGSIPFLASLFEVQVENIDRDVDTTYYEYLRHYRERTWLDTVKSLPARAKNWIAALFMSSPEVSASPEFNPYHLSRSQMNMVENLRSSIGIFVDKKTNVITLSFTDRDPRVAAIMADTIMERLQHEITQYRTKKAVDDCEYIKRMYLDAKSGFEESQRCYADFVSRNRNLSNEFVIIDRDRLQSDKDLKETIYTQWAQQLMLAEAKVQEKTPVFVTLKPAAIPAIPSSMGRAVKIILYAFMGAVFAVAYILMKDSVFSVWRKIMRKND